MSETTNQVLSWKDGEGNFIPHVNSFDLFGTKVRQNPCGIMNGAPNEDTIGVVGALIVDISTDSKKKDMWKCIGSTEVDGETPGSTKIIYQWNKVGSSSTEVVTSLPSVDAPNKADQPDEDVDYILYKDGVYLFYKWINNNWELIAGSISQVITKEELEELEANQSGNTYTDYYVPNPKTEGEGDDQVENIVSYFHYRWKEAASDEKPGYFVMIGTDSYSRAESDALFTGLVQRLDSHNAIITTDLQPKVKTLQETEEELSGKIDALQASSKNYELYYEKLPENISGTLPSEGLPLDNLLFLVAEKDGAYESTGYVKITGGGGPSEQLAEVKVTCYEMGTQTQIAGTQNILKGTKERWVTIKATVQQTENAPLEPATTYVWKNNKL
jgi:hypothetical protein